MNDFLKSLIHEYNLTGKDLANILGIKPPAVSQWESPDGINPETLYTISKLFNITIDDLLEGKHTGESTEERLCRLYNIDNINIKSAEENKNIEVITEYTGKVKNMVSKLYPLLYKKITASITENEVRELEYIKKYFRIDISLGPLYSNNNYLHEADSDIIIGKKIINALGADDEAAVLWELHKIYKCKAIISFAEWHTDEIRDNILHSLPPSALDKIATEAYQEENYSLAYKLISEYSANILYVFDRSMMTYYKHDIFEQLEGEKIPLRHINEAKETWKPFADFNYITTLNYWSYKKLINFGARKKAEMYAKYKDKNPYKLWEYIKKEAY